MAAAQTGLLEVRAVPVGERLPDQPTAGIDVETNRRFGIIRILRPAFNAFAANAVDKAAYITNRRYCIAAAASPARNAIRCRTASTS